MARSGDEVHKPRIVPSLSPDDRSHRRRTAGLSALLLFLVLAHFDTAHAEITTGVYRGNGTSLSITNVGFEPEMVMIKSEAANEAVTLTSTMTDDNTKPMIAKSALESGLITSLDSDGFSVGSDARVNSNGVDYYWVAFNEADGELAFGEYTGDNSNPRTIDISDTSSSTDFQPNYVWVMGEGDREASHRTDTVPTGDNETFVFNSAGTKKGRIHSFETNGFEIGKQKDVNETEDYHYVAWKAASGKVATGSYTGDGNDDRNIDPAGLDFDPQWLIIHGDAGGKEFPPVFRPFSIGATTDESLYFVDWTNAGNLIQSLAPSGCTTCFQVGMDGSVNADTVTYHWIAFGDATITEALLSRFGARYDGGRIVVTWETASEVATVGFYLFRFDWQEKAWLRVNDEMLLGLLHSPQGGTYSLVDEQASPDERLTYALVEIESKGGMNVFGPVDVVPGEDAALDTTTEYERRARAPSAKMLKRLEAQKAEKKEKKEKKKKLPKKGSTRVKVAVGERGLYYLDGSEIANLLGLSVADVQKLVGRHRLSLSNRGQGVAWLRGPMNQGLYFYGEAIESIYTTENIYWVEIGKGLKIKKKKKGKKQGHKGKKGAGDGTFTETLHLEEDRFAGTVVSTDPESDFWYWDYIVAGHVSDGSRKFVIYSPGVAVGGGEARLTVHLYGATTTGVPGEHHVLVRINGYDVGESHWEGIQGHAATLPLPQSYLEEGENTIELSGQLNAGVPRSIFYIDGFDLTYERRYEASGPTFFFRSEDHRMLSVDGLPHPSISIFDLSDPRHPGQVKKVSVTATASSYRASFVPPTRDALYFAVTPAGVKSPLWMASAPPSRLPELKNGADHVVIAPEEMAETAQLLADYRTEQGLTSMVFGLGEIMDGFNHGISNPYAVRDFLSHAYRKWRQPPRYVVLVGKGSLDYKDILGLGGNLVSPLMVGTKHGLYASDNRFADVEGDDGIPEMAVGRIPVLTNEELKAYLEKLRRSEAVASEKVLLLVDDPDKAGAFPTDSDELGLLIPPWYEVQKIYLSEMELSKARQQMFDAMAEGAMLMNYIGHSGMDRFAAEGLLRSEDVETLTSFGRLPVVAGFTCLTGRFEVPGFVSLGEALVVEPEAGAVAVWSPSGMSNNPKAKILNRAFFQAVFLEKVERLGDGIQRALQICGESGQFQLQQVYILLGDPATMMK